MQACIFFQVSLSDCKVTAGTYIALQPLYTYSNYEMLLYSHKKSQNISPATDIFSEILLTFQNCVWVQLWFTIP
jgi:hypothetical protein